MNMRDDIAEILYTEEQLAGGEQIELVDAGGGAVLQPDGPPDQ